MLMITGVASVGNGTDTLHYAYRPGLSQLETATWRNSQDAVLNSRTYAYDAYHRLTGINLNNASEVAYTLNDKDQRTAASYAVGGAWSHSYDDKSQVTGATGSNTTFSYAYDGIGNRLTAVEGSDTWSYTSNLLNQYTQVNTAQPTYDADGNMLTTGDGWTYAWNGENRLVRAEKDSTVVEMNYDYAGRRFEKKVYVNSEAGTTGTLQHHYKYVYDGYKLVELYDNDTLLVSFTWQPESVGGLDVPVSMTYAGNTYSYVTDGNKNVTALLDAAGFRVAGYAYGPFGQVLSMDGALAEVNPFRFSSEFHDDETGLVYYNYRYYSPSLGRWTKRDPIGETGGLNLYGMVDGQLVNCFDNYGLISIYAHGVNSNHVGYDSLRSALKSRISMPTNMFEQYSIDMNWAISNGKGGFINPTLKASDSIGYPSNWFQGLSDQQWRAVAKLKKIAQQLRKVIKSDTAFCSETVNIVAHSQGTLIYVRTELIKDSKNSILL